MLAVCVIRALEGTQTETFLAGVYGVSPSGTGKTVVVNANGQLGTEATQASATPSNTKLSRLQAQVRRQARQLRSQTRELRQIQPLHAEVQQLSAQIHGVMHRRS